MTTQHSTFPDLTNTDALLEKYADVLIHCGLGAGNGILPGEIVLVNYRPESELFIPYLQKSITRAGGHLLHDPEIDFAADHDPDAVLLKYGSPEQIAFFPLEAKKALYALAHHRLTIITLKNTDLNPHIGSEKNLERKEARRALIRLQARERETHWKSYTLAYFPTQALADQSHVSLQRFWDQVSKACYLQTENPVEHVRVAMAKTTHAETKLNQLHIRSLHIQGPACDVVLGMSPEARFRSAQGGNIPSYEVFTAPLASKTEGWIHFSYPLIYDGHTIEGLKVRFTEGEVTEWSATKGSEAFEALLKLRGMRFLGEFALTDNRLSRIDVALPSAPIYLENIGGTAHFAFGEGYKKCFANIHDTPDRNTASAHKDAVLDGEFTVTATLADDSQLIIFTNGQFPFL